MIKAVEFYATLRARAAWITAEAVAFMTAVTPPDWA